MTVAPDHPTSSNMKLMAWSFLAFFVTGFLVVITIASLLNSVNGATAIAAAAIALFVSLAAVTYMYRASQRRQGRR